MAEWLRRWTANPMCSARVGSNPILALFCRLDLKTFCILASSSLCIWSIIKFPPRSLTDQRMAGKMVRTWVWKTIGYPSSVKKGKWCIRFENSVSRDILGHKNNENQTITIEPKCFDYAMLCLKRQVALTTRMGFEPTRAEHIGLAVQRVNHSNSGKNG